MKQFFNIFKFEFSSYLKNKIFVGGTLCVVIIICAVLSYPRISAIFKNDSKSDEAQMTTILANVENAGDKDVLANLLKAGIKSEIELTDKTKEEMTSLVDSGEYDSAVFISSPTKYTYIIKDTEMFDNNKLAFDEIVLMQYRHKSMVDAGVSGEKSNEILATTIESDTIQTGKNQMENFFYTYILIFALYTAIMLYGQLVATNVASEKSSRAMELLITSAKPSNFMFGKVLGAGAAGLLQMSTILGASFIFFKLNQSLWKENAIVNSIFNMPASIIFYTMLFFVLGYLLYSFLFGAVGSLASKVEDINTSSMPVIFTFIIAFFIVAFSLNSGNINSPLMIIASYVPFTSPMAMFTRIAMSNVAPYEIIISAGILILSVWGIGVLSAKIYKIGVLLYGKPPKMSTIIKALMKK